MKIVYLSVSLFSFWFLLFQADSVSKFSDLIKLKLRQLFNIYFHNVSLNTQIQSETIKTTSTVSLNQLKKVVGSNFTAVSESYLNSEATGSIS